MQSQGLQGFKSELRGFAAFPDARMVIDDMVHLEDKVVIRDTCSGTNTGDFFGMGSTGRGLAPEEESVG